MARKLSPNAEFFVKRVETMLRVAGFKGGLEAQACRFLTGEDLKVAAFVWAKLMSYKYGVPKQTLEVSGTVDHSLSATDRAAAQQTIQKLLTPAPIDVEAKEVIQ